MTFRIVQLMSGSIDFSTAKGVGTTFRLRFPAELVKTAGEAAAAAGAENTPVVIS
jgi:signal transduction histidine kinase